MVNFDIIIVMQIKIKGKNGFVNDGHSFTNNGLES